MKQSTSFAQVANNLLTVLQGYSKTIRLLLVMFLTLTVSANAWGQTWTRVTTMEQLTSGGTFIMGYEATAKSGTIVPLRSADCNATTSANGYFHTGTTANSSTNSTITMSSVVNTSAYEVYISSPASGKINIQRATSTGNYYGASSEGSSKNTARLYTEGNTTETNLIVEWASETNNQFKLKTGVSGAYKYLKYNTSAPRFAFYNSAGEKIVFYKKSAPAYTITATSNNDSYGTVSVSGTTITATPNAGYRVKSGDAGYTVTSGTADVTNNGDNTFSVTPSSNCTITINFEAIPTHQIIFNTGGLNVIAPISVAEGSTYNITQEPIGLTNECEYNTFIGWTEESSIAEASTKPTLVESITMGSSDITLYAVYSKTEGGNSTTTNTSSDVTLKDGVYNSSVSTITWTIADVITIKQETNGAQTAVSSSYISAPRWYAGHMITMTPLVNITSIVVTATSESYASELQSSTYTNATASVSSTKVTITPITGTLPITIVLGKQSRISSITVNYSTSNAGATTYSLTPECSTETLVSVLPKITNF